MLLNELIYGLKVKGQTILPVAKNIIGLVSKYTTYLCDQVANCLCDISCQSSSTELDLTMAIIVKKWPEKHQIFSMLRRERTLLSEATFGHKV